jgi:hypothetical protein
MPVLTKQNPFPSFPKKETMKRFRTNIFCSMLLAGLSAATFAQAPIERQAPPPPPPDQQQAQPSNQQPGQPAYPQSGQPQQQAPPPDHQQGPPMPLQQLDQLVQRIALYPDPLLAQVLAAATFWNQIPDAASWAELHNYLTGDALAQAIQADNLPWDPSVLALLPFPSVLDTMAHDPQWTGTLGNAVLDQRSDVMDAVQRLRREARSYGYLQPNAYDNVVDNGGYVEIQPVDPASYYIPIYNPGVVFYAPRPGLVVGAAIRFGPVVTIGPAFGRFGWHAAGFGWGGHAILIDNHPWARTYANRGVYVHPYAHPYVHSGGPRVESHSHEHGNDHHR